jgi:guanylate kinase
MKRRGILFCLVGPAGSGKTTLAADLLARPGLHIRRSVSHTTRAPRADEILDESYHFVSRAEFLEQQAADVFFESEEIHGNWYGTSKVTLQGAVSEGRDLLLVIDIHGALNLKRAFPQDCIVVFVVPPRFSEIPSRVQARGQVAQAELEQRLATAREEYRILRELQHSNPALIDYLMVNAVLNEAAAQLAAIVRAEQQRLERVVPDALQELLSGT